MEYKDYYKVLGVAKTATQDEVKRAYKKLVRKYHPDINKDSDAEQTFKDVNEANEVLGNLETRAAYDMAGQSHQPGQDFRPPPGWDEGFEYSGAQQGSQAGQQDFSEFFESMFGEARRQQAEPRARSGFQGRGEDHHAVIHIDLEDSFKGPKRQITFKVPEVSNDGHLSIRKRNLAVTIPKGVREGQIIRLAMQGSPGIGGGPAGDLYIEISFKPHAFYHAEGADLFLELPVTPWEAALGGKITAPTPDGKVDLNIPAGSPQGRKLRLKGRGLPGKPAGDLFVSLRIVLPKAGSERSKEIYRMMEKELGFDPRENMNKVLG